MNQTLSTTLIFISDNNKSKKIILKMNLLVLSSLAISMFTLCNGMAHTGNQGLKTTSDPVSIYMSYLVYTYYQAYYQGRFFSI